MKKLILILFASILLVVSVFAINGMVQIGNKIGDKTSYNVGVEVKKGWNLLVDVSPELITLNKIRNNGGDIQEENLKAIYAFDPKNQQYLQWYPNPEADKLRQMSADGFELLSTPFWVYSNKAGYLKFESDYILDLNKRDLYSGWNFVAITPEFLGKKFSELKGNCNVLKAYIYNNKVYTGHTNPSWEKIYDDTPFSQDAQAMGFIIKVNGACKLGSEQSNIAPPPSLPI